MACDPILLVPGIFLECITRFGFFGATRKVMPAVCFEQPAHISALAKSPGPPHAPDNPLIATDPFEQKDNWITAAVGAFSIVFMNLSLQSNSIGASRISLIT